jgi:uncharacterized RDD family membrane protein YckC
MQGSLGATRKFTLSCPAKIQPAVTQRLRTALYPRIADISIGVGAIGIIAHLATTFSRKVDFLSYLVVTTIRDYTYVWFGGLSDGRHRVSPVTLLLMAMLILGGVIYKKTGGKDSRVLRLGYSVIFVQKLLLLINVPLGYLMMQRVIASGISLRGEVPGIWQYILSVLYGLLLGWLAFLFTKWLIADQGPVFQKRVLPDGSTVNQVIPVSRWKRFAHFIFDAVLMFLLVAPTVFLALQFIGEQPFAGMRSLMRAGADKYVLSLAIGVGMVLYYLLFEGFFRATPAKFISGTRVINANTLESPGFGQILGRTFSRRIPFETLSFLGSKGWHDSLSGTTLAAEDNFGQRRGYHVVWGLALLSIYVGSFAYVKVSEMIDRRRSQAFHTNTAIEKLKSSVANLQPGDLIGLRMKDNYSASGEVLKVISASATHITSQRYISPQYQSMHTPEDVARVFATDGWLLIDTTTLDRPALMAAVQILGNKDIQTGDGTLYHLTALFGAKLPIFTSSGSSYRREDDVEKYTHRFSFDKASITVESIEMLEGTVEWSDTFPLETPFDEAYARGQLVLQHRGQSPSFKAVMHVLYQGRRHDYIIAAYDRNWEIYPAYRE